MAVETITLSDGTVKYRGKINRLINGVRKVFNTGFKNTYEEALEAENKLKKQYPPMTTGRKPGGGMGVGQLTDEEATEKYGRSIDKKFKAGSIKSKKWSEMTPNERLNVTADTRFMKALDERVIKFKLGGKNVELPKGRRVSSLRQTVAPIQELVNNLKKWEKNPTPAKWSEIMGNKIFGKHLRSYLLGKNVFATPLPEQTKQIFDDVNIKQFIKPENIEKINELTTKGTLKTTTSKAAFAKATEVNKQKIINELNFTNKDPIVNQFIKNQQFGNSKVRKVSEYLGKKLKLPASVAARRIQELASAYMGNSDYLNLKSKDPEFMKGVARITNIVKSSPFQDFGSGFKRDLYEKYISKSLGEKPSFMQVSRSSASKLMPRGYDIDEIRNIATGAKLDNPGYSIFTQGVKKNINLNAKRKVDRAVEIAERELQKLSPFDPNYDEKRNIIQDKYNKVARGFTKEINKGSKGSLPVRALELSFDEPSTSVARYNELPDNVTSLLDKNYDEFEYSFKVPKDVKTVYEVSDEIKSNPNFLKKAFAQAKKGAPRVFGLPIAAGIGYGLTSELSDLGQAMASEPDQIPTLDSDVEFGDPDTWDMKIPQFIEEYPILTGAGATGAALATKPGREVGKSIVRNFPLAFNPLTAAGLTYGLRPEEGYDFSDPLTRVGFEAEAAFSKDLVRASQQAARKIPASSPLLRRATQGILNLGLPARVAMGAARIASPLGWLSLAGEGAYQLYNLAQEEQARIDAMTPEQQQEFFAEQEEISRFSASEGGRAGFKDGSDPKDPTRRKFMKTSGGILGLATALGTGLIKYAPQAAKEVQKIKSTFSDMSVPGIVEELYSTIRNFGKMTDYNKKGVVNYEMGPYKLEEGPEGYNITKRTDDDLYYQEEYFSVYKDPETGGVQYEELTVTPDAEGKLKDVDYGVDVQTYRDIGKDIDQLTKDDFGTYLAEQDIETMLNDGGTIIDQGIQRSGK